MTPARPLLPGDLGEVVDVVVSAFLDYPYWCWLVDDVGEREATMRAYYAVDLAPLLEASWGVEDGAGGLVAIAIWIRSGGDGQALVAAESTPAAGRAAERMAAALAVMDEMAPPGPHWYLDVLAARPAAQGQGFGRSVLAPGLARAERDAIGCYLETGKPANLGFYGALGFHVTAERDVPGVGAPGPARAPMRLWGMWRPAGGPSGRDHL